MPSAAAGRRRTIAKPSRSSAASVAAAARQAGVQDVTTGSFGSALRWPGRTLTAEPDDCARLRPEGRRDDTRLAEGRLDQRGGSPPAVLCAEQDHHHAMAIPLREDDDALPGAGGRPGLDPAYAVDETEERVAG